MHISHRTGVAYLERSTAKKRTYGFGQSMVWYAMEENAATYINKLARQISEYVGENWIDISAADA